MRVDSFERGVAVDCVDVFFLGFYFLFESCYLK